MRKITVLAMMILGGVCLAVAGPKKAEPGNLVVNGDMRLRDAAGIPDKFTVEGSADFRFPGDARADVADWSASLHSTGPSGSVSQTIDGIDLTQGKWFRFTFKGLPQEHFTVTADALFMKVDFLGSDGTTYDGKLRKLYPHVTQARKDLTVNGDRHRKGSEVWQTYQLDFMVPFPQVRRMRLTVGFDHGSAAASNARSQSDFFATDFSLVRIAEPQGVASTQSANHVAVATYDRFIPLGGRWFYAAKASETAAPSQFDSSNADRLLYHDVAYTAPFAGNITAWLHKNNIDLAGKTVLTDRFIEDNLTITFDKSSIIFHSHGLPNHPTAVFPSQGFGDGNPSSIVEQNNTFYIPLNPTENPSHVVTAKDNSNHALPMGPIGVAVNGVVFFNPFDAGNQDASSIMDRCCGHPNPMGQYHYHKYPVCINSPWADEGKEHSALIGFAFDGYPVYGPYESTDVMAKDLTGEHKLNDFNMHYDADRGWHYHVTPGVFPYIIGGYWGTEDSRDAQRPPRGNGRRPRPGSDAPPGGRRPFEGPPPGP